MIGIFEVYLGNPFLWLKSCYDGEESYHLERRNERMQRFQNYDRLPDGVLLQRLSKGMLCCWVLKGKFIQSQRTVSKSLKLSHRKIVYIIIAVILGLRIIRLFWNYAGIGWAAHESQTLTARCLLLHITAVGKDVCLLTIWRHTPWSATMIGSRVIGVSWYLVLEFSITTVKSLI